MTHFVYVYIKSDWQELLYSIRSIQKYFKGDKFKIFVVGDNPNIKNIIHIPCDRVKGGTMSKAFDSVNKLQKIVDTPQIKDDFIYMYDDIMLLQNLNKGHFKAIAAHEYVDDDFDFTKWSYNPSPEWKSLFTRTITKLRAEGKRTWNYETHLRKEFNKKHVQDIINKYKLTENAYLFNTLYFNNVLKAPYYNLKKTPNIKAGIYRPIDNYDTIRKMCLRKWFLNYNDSGLNKHLQDLIKNIVGPRGLNKRN